MASIAPTLRDVEAALTYCVDTGEKPVSGSLGPGGHQRYQSGTYEPRVVTIRDGRPLADTFSIEREGFRFIRHDTRVRDFFDADELRAVYVPEVERIVKETTGATRAVIFDHTRRVADESVQREKLVGGPVRRVHNDYTEWSGPQRVRDLLPEEADALLRHRFQVMQLWRPMRGPVLAQPLAICDAGSIAPADLIPTERRYPDRVGEIYHIAYNPAHRWFYFPEMERNEALVFKCYDSLKDGRARFTAHAAFDDPATPAGAPPRQSIESRILAFFAPEAT